MEPRFSDVLSVDILPSLVKQSRDAADALNARKTEVSSDMSEQELRYVLSLLEDMTTASWHAHYVADSLFTTETNSEAYRQALTNVERESSEVRESLLWFTMELKTWPAERLQYYAEELPAYRIWFQDVVKHQKHILSQAEERVIIYKDRAGSSALDKLYTLITSKYVFELTVDGKIVQLSYSELRPYLLHKKRELRKAAVEATPVPYERDKDELATIYQALVDNSDTETVDLRGYASAIGARHLSNNLPDEAYRALVASSKRHQKLFREYITIKQRVLGLPDFQRWDFGAPVDGLPDSFPYEDAKKRVLGVFARFAPWMHEHAQAVFASGRVDAFSRKHKRDGAFCVPMVPGEQALMMLNHNDTLDSLFTMAHELGHVVHETLAKKNSILVFQPQIVLAEMASTFAEELLLRDLLREATPKERTALLCHSIDEAIRSIPTQLRYTQFEEEAHALIEQGKSASELDALWAKLFAEDFPDVPLPKTSVLWRSIPHMYHSPFYCYSYAFGQLLVLSLLKRYDAEGSAFIPKFKDILEAGGSREPAELLAEHGFDVTLEAFWDAGFAVLAERVEELRKLV